MKHVAYDVNALFPRSVNTLSPYLDIARMCERKEDQGEDLNPEQAHLTPCIRLYDALVE